jgi:SPP1 gp7 family putative phage head morphogenesis protein
MAGASIPDDPDRFEEAIRQFRKRVPMTDAQWEKLTEAEREFSFKVSGVSQAELVNDAWEEIDRAIADGTTLDDFKQAVGDRLEQAWGGADPARLETVFRTNTQQAYNGGRHEVLSHPEVKKARPFLRFDAVMDSRTSDICDALDGTVRPADDPFWDTHHPPLHFNCRSILTPLSEEEAGDEGVDRAPTSSRTTGSGSCPRLGATGSPTRRTIPVRSETS